MIDEDALKIDDFSVIGPREEDAASLPSFKPLAEHRRANSTPKPPARAQRERITSPPLDLPLLLIPEPVAPPRVPCLHWRILRALALLLIGSGIGAALVYAASESGHQPKTEAKYYTVLPFAVPAVPPQEILYVDKWRIVAIDPSSLRPLCRSRHRRKS